jgi:hypothetical protein
MRVEVSPWEIADTSFHHGNDASAPASLSPKRRRQRSDSLSNKNEKHLTASFIDQTSSSMRSRKKIKGKKGRSSKASSFDYEDRMPVLTVTSPHRIAVMVEGDANGDNFSSTGLEESTIVQFASRPSKATAFLPIDDCFERNGKHIVKAHLPCIPAVFDAQQSRVYALQSNNTKVVSYSAASSAGEMEPDASSSISVHLDHAASSLALLHLPRSANCSTPRCVVYGTCQDGRLFAACVSCGADKKEQLLVEYLGSTTATRRSSLADSPQEHVGTLAYLATSTKECSGGKRKLDDSFETDSWMIMIYQLFQEERGIAMVRQKVQIAPVHGANGSPWATAVVAPRHQSTSFSVDLLSDHKGDGAPLSVSHACALGFVEGNNAISVFYRVKNTSSADTPQTSNGMTTTIQAADVEQCFYTCISLRTGQVIGAPTLLPATTQQVGLVGPALLAVLTADRAILLFDTIRGAHMHSCRPLPPQDEGGCTLVTDSKRSRLAIVFVQKDKYAVAFSSVHAENDVGMHPLLRGPRMSLAAGLASSLKVSALSIAQGLPNTFVLEASLTNCVKENVHEQKAITKGERAECSL